MSEQQRKKSYDFFIIFNWNTCSRLETHIKSLKDRRELANIHLIETQSICEGGEGNAVQYLSSRIGDYTEQIVKYEDLLKSNNCNKDVK